MLLRFGVVARLRRRSVRYRGGRREAWQLEVADQVGGSREQVKARVLVNACDESVTYPLDGSGLRFYPTTVDDGDLFVDINELSTTTTDPG